MAGSFTTLALAVESGVLTILFNRPDRLNVFDAELGLELATALRSAQRDESIRCVLLTATGRAFCAGQDIRQLAGEMGPRDLGTYLREVVNPLIQRIRGLEKPVVAALNGIAAGVGASLALATDLRVAVPGAGLRMAFIHLGLVPDGGATYTLMQHAGYARAAELCLLGETLPAEEALHWGLYNRVVPEDELLPVARDLAGRLARLPAGALALTKRTLHDAWNATLDEQLEREAFAQSTLARTADHREGLAAFLEKRPPRFPAPEEL
ncbi:MAG: enoyl-CoA hydratase/isomerase family protein [Phycisphaerales bacterium]|nr:enoyl-CoA hydratase/isomerase family protein [Phycisphaerales bacterium]